MSQLSRRTLGRFGLGATATGALRLPTAEAVVGPGGAGAGIATRPGHAAWTAYPKGARPTALHVLPRAGLDTADAVLAATLQGLLARRPGEGIYLEMAGLGYGVWLQDLADRYVVPLRPATDVWDLVDRFRRDAGGYVLYDEPEVNVATTVAGMTGAVAVEAGKQALAERHGLRLAADVRGRDDAWVRDTYWGRLRHDVVFEQRPELADELRDYAAMAGAYAFYDGNTALREQILGALDSDASVIGWGDATGGEDDFVGPSSDTGVRTIAADHARNLSVLSSVRAEHVHQRPAGPLPNGNDKHDVTFLCTDGDNVQWLLGDFQSDQRWYAAPNRGTGLGWGVAPGLVDLAPSVLRWYYDHAGQDRFTVGPSGAGYFYPSRYPRADLDRHTARLADDMTRADLGVVQIIDVGSFDDTSLWSSYLRQKQIEGLIYLEYSRYDGLGGRIVWADDKPVISARAMLWDGLDGADEASVTAELNASPADPHSQDGYSVVMWHAWSKTAADVQTVIDGLAPHIEVVPPDTLVKLAARDIRR